MQINSKYFSDQSVTELSQMGADTDSISIQYLASLKMNDSKTYTRRRRPRIEFSAIGKLKHYNEADKHITDESIKLRV